MPTPIWEPGKSQYAEWKKTLTPEQYEQHMIARKQRKTMKRAFEQVVAAQQEVWISRINEGLVSVLKKAIDTGDSAALAVVFDRIIGKPTETIQSEVTTVLPWNSTETTTNTIPDDTDDTTDTDQ